MKPKILALGLAAVLVVGGGAFALTRFMAPNEDAAVALVPRDAFAYASIFTDFSNGQKMAADDLADKFGLDGAEDLIDKITEALDEGLASQGLTYDQDVDPWFGSQIAAFGVPPETEGEPVGAAVLFESEDDEEAEAFVDKAREEDAEPLEEREHNGTTYRAGGADGSGDAFAVIGGFLVAGNETGVKSVIDSSAAGEGLEESEKFTAAVESLPDDWIAQFYVDSAAVLEAAAEGEPGAAEALAFLGGEDQPPAAGVFYVTSGSVVFETVGGIPEEGPLASFGRIFSGSGVVAELPAQAWLAIGIPEIGELFSGIIETFAGVPGLEGASLEEMFLAETGLSLEQDLLSWMGDAGLFVQGTNIQELGGGLMIESTDAAKTRATVGKLRELVEREGVPTRPEERGGLEGFSVQMPGVPGPIYLLGGERLVLSYGEAATEGAISTEDTLGGSEGFQEATNDLGDDYQVGFYVDMDTVQTLVETFIGFSGQGSATYEQDVKRYLDPIAHLVAGSRQEGDNYVQKFLIGVR